MNLKHLKKVHEDEKVAIFKHPSAGHEVRIAKAGLSAGKLKALKDLPLYESDGDVIEDPTKDLVNSSQNADQPQDYVPGQQYSNASLLPPDEQSTLTPKQHSFTDPEAQLSSPLKTATDYLGNRVSALESNFTAPMPSEANAQEDASAPTQMPETQQPAPASDPNAAPQQQQPAQQGSPADEVLKTPAQHLQDLNTDANNFKYDIEAGHITPKTYADLFADKSTLGKIGSLFALMVAGAGSGLAHQPNMLMDMMNKELERDYDAQKQNVANKMSFYRLNSELGLNAAKIKQMVKEGKLTEAQAQGVQANTLKTVQELSMNQGSIAALHNIQMMTNGMPAAKQPAAQGVLNNLKNMNDAQILKRNVDAAQSMTNPAMSEQDYNNNVNALSFNMGNPALRETGEKLRGREVPGVGYSNQDLTKEDKDRITKIHEFNNLINEYQGLFNKVGSARGNLGVLTPSEKTRSLNIRNDLILSSNDVKGITRFSGNEEQLYKDIVPFLGKMNLTGSQQDSLNRLRDSVSQKYKTLLHDKGITPFSGSNQAQQQAGKTYPDGTTGTINGQPVIWKNGRTVPR